MYVTLPPAWLGRCAVKNPVMPYFTYPDFTWYEEPLTNSDPHQNFGQNFFRTAINDDPAGDSGGANLVFGEKSLSAAGDDDGSPYEPWLYDRAMTMFTIYLRSGNVAVLREAHRAAYFYASKLNADGGFTLKPDEGEGYDLKYSYNECLFTDLLLLGDTGHLPQINAVTTIAATFNYVYQGDRRLEELWTERHLAFSWLAFIVAYEATGNPTYAQEARLRADAVYYHQNHPPADVDHGQAPNDGALMHGYDHHEGVGLWVEDHQKNGVSWWIFSPWQTTLLVDVMQRYYFHSGDVRVLAAAQRFGDAAINVADTVRPEDPEVEDPAVGYPEPWYLASSQGSYTTRDMDDWEHCLEVAKITAFAYYCSILQGSPRTAYLTHTQRLLAGAQKVIPYWIRVAAHDVGKSIYRLSPARKFSWWFRTTSDLDYLLHLRTAFGPQLFLLLSN